MKLQFKRISLIALILLHIFVIFSFSLQDAWMSTEVSTGFTKQFMTVEEENKDYEDALSERRFYKLEAFLRKAAHFSLFFLLGVWLNLLMGEFNLKGGFRASASVMFAMAVAFIDETLQLFSPGRAGRITDVLLDSCGALFAAILFIAGGVIYGKIKNKRSQMDNCKH